MLAVIICLIYQLCKFNILPFRYAAIAIGAMLMIGAIFMALSKSKKPKNIITILELLFIGGFAYANYNLYITYNLLTNVIDVTDDNTTSVKTDYTDSVSIIVMADSNIEAIADLDSRKVGIDNSFDADRINYASDWISETYSIEYEANKCENIEALISDLYAENYDAIILETTRASLMDNIVETFSEDTKVLAVLPIDYSKMPNAPATTPSPTEEPRKEGNLSDDKDITESPFIIYISGIDTKGTIETKSRSDTNILMCVNPNTKKILLVSTPRDTYTPLYNVSGGVYDKLTHAGLYGPECSMGTLETIYDIGIDYYLRVNFTSVVNIVDALGGVEVYSEYSFSSKNIRGYYFSEGYNQVDGKAALVFCRERYSFSDGDRQRGRNHIEMIKAVINKCITPSILLNYADLITALDGSFQTNMSMDEITSLIKMQIDDGASWEFESLSLETTNSTSTTCYSLSGPSLYVGLIDEESQAEIQAAIKEFMN